MPAMPRPKGLATDIAYSILGTPPNMPYKKYTIARKHVSKPQTSLPQGNYNETKDIVSHGMMGGGYL